MSKFPWGKVIEIFVYDFDGEEVEVVKYNPYKEFGRSSKEFSEDVEYHIEDLHESAHSLQYILISWMAKKNLGLNQHSLVAGICRALEVK